MAENLHFEFDHGDSDLQRQIFEHNKRFCVVLLGKSVAIAIVDRSMTKEVTFMKPSDFQLWMSVDQQEVQMLALAHHPPPKLVPCDRCV